MKAITVCEPYASAIIIGPKRVENRPQPWKFRGRLLIHAGKSQKFMGTLTKEQLDQWNPELSGFRLGHGEIIGSVEVYDCIEYATHPDYLDEPWAFGPYCLLLRDPEPFAKPIPYRGALGLFDVPDHVLKATP